MTTATATATGAQVVRNGSSVPIVDDPLPGGGNDAGSIVVKRAGKRRIGNGKNSGMVYMIEATGLGLVKIGQTRYYKRIEAIIRECPVEARLIALIHTSEAEAVEAKIHADFADFRSKREWFSVTADTLVGYVAQNDLLSGRDLEKWAVNRCIVCGAGFPAKSPRRVYCSKACLQKAYRWRNGQSAVTLAKNVTDCRGWYVGPGRPGIVRACDHCGRSYEARRSSSRFCSSTCRVAAWHAARRDGLPVGGPEAQ